MLLGGISVRLTEGIGNGIGPRHSASCILRLVGEKAGHAHSAEVTAELVSITLICTVDKGTDNLGTENIHIILIFS